MKKINILVAIFVFAFTFVSCSDDDDEVPAVPKGEYENGILISNEGPWGSGTGTITYISDDYSLIEQEIFKKVNNSDIGNVLQSIGFYNDNAYLVANTSNTVTVVDRYTFKEMSVISEGFNNPRYFVEANGKGYVTNWGDPNSNDDDFVAVINLSTNLVESTIAVQFGPEKIIAVDNTIYVAHKGGYGQNNLVSVIDANTNDVSKTIEVGFVPNSLTLDNMNNLWVLSGGNPSWSGAESKGVLSKINTSTNVVTSSIDFSETEHPDFLSFDENNLYYNLNGNVYKMNVSASELPTNEVISGLYSYNMVVDNGVLYSTDAGDFASNGKIYVYDLTTNSISNTFTTGLIPGGIYFN